MINLNLVANTLGILSLMSSIIAFSPSLLRLDKKTHIQKKYLLKLAHRGLLVTICLGLIHGLLTTQREKIDFYNLNTYWIYAEGLFSFNLLVFLAFTFTEFKSDLKKLSYFSYGALFLLIFHIGQQIMPSL